MDLLLRRIEPDGTETHMAIRAEYDSAPPLREGDHVEHLKKYFPALYNCMFGGENYERIKSG